MTQCFSSRDRRLVWSIRRLPHTQHLHQARPPVCSIGVPTGEGRGYTLPPRQDWGYTAWEWGHPVGIRRFTDPLFYQIETYLCFWHLLQNTECLCCCLDRTQCDHISTGVKVIVESLPRSESSMLSVKLGSLFLRDLTTQGSIFPVLVSPKTVH